MVNMHKRRPDERRAHATPVQKTARVAAIVLGLLGILGFIPGITAEYGQLEVTGIGADALLFGLLPVTITHNVLMLLFAAGIYAAAQRSVGAMPRLSTLAPFETITRSASISSESPTTR